MSRIPVLKAREDVIRLKGKKIIFQLNLQKHQALDLKRYEGEKATCFVSWMENLPMSFASPYLVYLGRRFDSCFINCVYSGCILYHSCCLCIF